MFSHYPLGFPIVRDAAETLGAVLPAPGMPLAERVAVIRAVAASDPAWRPAELLALVLVAEVQRALIHTFAAPAREAGATVLDRAAWFDRYPAAEAGAASWSDEAVAGEVIGLWLLVGNPALAAYRPLLSPGPLPATVGAVVHAAMRPLGAARVGGAAPLLDSLRRAREAHPDDIVAQLQALVARFADVLPSWLHAASGLAADVAREERSARGGGPGPPPRAMDFAAGDAGPSEECFAVDRRWMAELVLVAKQTYVWLDQLSRDCGRALTRLDDIPDEALDVLRGRGITGLWLIGVWERSPASRTIKRWRGNPEALASAYALVDYTIAQDLGGEAAWEALDRRCRARGIRLATDMVPNHTGLDSAWMVDHPERFMALDAPPYPGYRFSSEDLAADPRITVRIEDGYWDHSDAAVVFEVTHHEDGRVRYVYHGNDGTQMPWNDTAQLNYADPAVRQAVSDTILAVAQRASIIRFDAAMTLARKHVQRLWWPPPGEGGAIPSRAERSITNAEFAARMPREFWREVVERVAVEAPDTLLLAEAFWLMEGYFVRTLGMHRVYNSAFMHMLRDEDNAGYRKTLANVLGYSAEVLGRFVNFMNNPDEETAVAQFGSGDKYFGVATLLATLPGLPMFGHGQFEGLAEKYGMEYHRAYWDESPDAALVARHQRQITPLLRRRRTFASAKTFALFTLRGDTGEAEDTFVYANRDPESGDAALVVYQNAYREAAGWVHTSEPARYGGTEAALQTLTLVEALGIPASAQVVVFRELVSGQALLRRHDALRERGMFLSVGAYQTQVFTIDAAVRDDRLLRELERSLAGRPVADLDAAFSDLVAPSPNDSEAE